MNLLYIKYVNVINSYVFHTQPFPFIAFIEIYFINFTVPKYETGI